MKDLSLFVEKFKRLLGSRTSEKEIVVKILEESIGLKVEESAVTVRNGIAYVEGSPTFKNHILTKKRLVLEKIKNLSSQSKINIIDIR